MQDWLGIVEPYIKVYKHIPVYNEAPLGHVCCVHTRREIFQALDTV